MASHAAEKSRLDDAARAGWLYFIAGNTQDEIARKLQISRPAAQRLVSLALEKRLITFRLEHPIAACLELAKRLTDRFALAYCDVVPSDPGSSSPVIGVAEAAAALLEQTLRSDKPTVIAIGTGRAMRAAAEQVPTMDCPNHQLVSLVGNISPDGSASFFDALTLLADRTKSRHYPIPLPLYASTPDELQQLLALEPVRRVRALGGSADLRMVGVGQVDLAAPLVADGFLSREGLHELMRLGAAGEITGWAIDAEGEVIDGGANRRLTSLPVQQPPPALSVGVAQGPAKVKPIRAALKGQILNGLITDEKTAAALLDPC